MPIRVRILMLSIVLVYIGLMHASPNIDSYVATNAVAPLNIPAYVQNSSAQDEILHPDVLYFPSGWNGYKYWMAFTPFPNTNAVYENPSIVVSNDNVSWIVPPGATNPIDSFASSASTYNSDPDLLMSPDGNTMYCIWRRVVSWNTETIFSRSTTDGITWTNKVTVLTHITTNSGSLISPSIIYQNGKYMLWYVKKGTPRQVMYREAASITGTWSAPVLTNILPFSYDINSKPLTETWHIDVIYHNGYYWMINQVGPYQGYGGELFLGYSEDGIAWVFGSNPVLSPVSNAWDKVLYRASLVPLNDNTNNFRIWYSTERTGSTPAKIAYTETVNDETLPVELSSFTASAISQNQVKLVWTTQSETNVLGYYIYRSRVNDINDSELVSPLIRAANTSALSLYSFVDDEVTENGSYYYWLQNLDLDGGYQMHGSIRIVMESNQYNTPPPIPLVTRLQSVYPNPFNPNVTISFSLAKTDKVELSIYNLKSEKICTLAATMLNAGTHSRIWNGKDEAGKSVSSGVYVIRYTAGNHSSIQKVVLVK
ncbi:MAG: T9SS type A sorting domain-containing protein [Candidatus Cloacimonetes bacterium]|nr:T9SS type A sorting domain-containing protein [Candidatus Cloacimonadota bacterium]